jgi:drug/metabolite transporter (DMT)-like permease
MRDNYRKAVLCLLLSAFGFSLMAAAVKLAGPLPLAQKVFFRNFVTLLITTVAALRLRENPLARARHRGLLVARSVTGLIGVFLYFYAVDNLTLADAAILTKLAPFFVMLFAAWLLREKLAPRTWPLLGGALLGAALVVKPRFDMPLWPALAGVGSAIASGLAYTLVRGLKNREPAHRIVFWFSLISTAVTLPLMLAAYVAPTGRQWLCMLGTGVFAAVGQFALTWGYQLGLASRVAIYDYTLILWSVGLDLVLWRTRPDALTLLGGTLIVTTGVINHRRAMREDAAGAM